MRPDDLGVVLQQEPCMADVPQGIIWNGDCCHLLCVLFWILDAGVVFPRLWECLLLLFGFFTFYSESE